MNTTNLKVALQWLSGLIPGHVFLFPKGEKLGEDRSCQLFMLSVRPQYQRPRLVPVRGPGVGGWGLGDHCSTGSLNERGLRLEIRQVVRPRFAGGLPLCSPLSLIDSEDFFFFLPHHGNGEHGLPMWLPCDDVTAEVPTKAGWERRSVRRCRGSAALQVQLSLRRPCCVHSPTVDFSFLLCSAASASPFWVAMTWASDELQQKKKKKKKHKRGEKKPIISNNCHGNLRAEHDPELPDGADPQRHDHSS